MKRFGLALVIAALLVVASAPAALATTTRTPSTGAEILMGIDDWGSVVNDGKTETLRGMEDHALLFDTPGWAPIATQTAVVNYDRDLASQRGSIWGTSHLMPLGSPDGWFDCSWHGTYIPGTAFADWAGKSVCHGFGTLEGWQMRSDIASAIFPGGLIGTTSVTVTFRPGV